MDVRIRPLQESDPPEAGRIFRVAFGTLLRLPDPESFALFGPLTVRPDRWGQPR